MTTATIIERVLACGSKPAEEADVLALLDTLGIDHTTTHHEPVFTVAEAKLVRGDAPGAHVKNLFLRNKKGRMWLVTCHEDRQIDLKQMGDLLGAGRLSFASHERLMLYLGVIPGAVTPLAVINDHGNKVVTVLDDAVLRDDIINVHPLHNAATTCIAPTDLLRYLGHLAHEPVVVDMEPLSKR